MKKYLFIVLASSLFIFILIYFYDKREIVLNKEYMDNNVYIEYPFFNNHTIDSYINNYLYNIIYNYSSDNLFVDYDYDIDGSIIDLSIYSYKSVSNIIKKTSDSFVIDMDSGEVSRVIAKDNDIEYDFYKQKFIDKSKPMVALTFDDGPNYNTSKVLDILEKYNVKATFFILGSNIKGNEGIIKRMNELDMEIGNHMYSHKLITKLKNQAINKEITKVDNLVFDIIGEYPTLVRPSYGTFNKRIKSLVDRPIIIWNVDTLDWKNHSSKRISKRVFRNIGDGDIVLMHDIYSATANSLEIIIPKLLDMGYQIVTVSELFYYKGEELSHGKVYGSVG